MVLIVLFLPYLILSELRRANHASHCYFFYNIPESFDVEKIFRTRTDDFAAPLLQYNAEQPTAGILEVSLSALTGFVSSLLAPCTNQKNRMWQPGGFKFELQFGDVVYCSNPHEVIVEGERAKVIFDHKIAFQVVRGMIPELYLKVYGCRVRKLTHGVKVKAVLGTATVDLRELINGLVGRDGARQLTESFPLERRGEEGREQARVDLHLSYRHNQGSRTHTRAEELAYLRNEPEGVTVTGPDGAVWIARPSSSSFPVGEQQPAENKETREYVPNTSSSAHLHERREYTLESSTQGVT